MYCRVRPGNDEHVAPLLPTLLIGAFCMMPSLALAEIPLDQRRSSYEQMSPATKAMQDDDTSNPATLSVLDGEALWNQKMGRADKACADCHGDAATAMKGVAARYPAAARTGTRLFDIEQRINLCHTGRQEAQPFAHESRELLALTAYLGQQSRGMPIAISEDEKTKTFIEAGRKLYSTRQGQLNLSCQTCHDDNWGQKLAGVPLVQGHPNGYPLYRLEWQSVGSLQRRLRNCMIGMRAEPYAYGSEEYVALELFLMWRARGMIVETPAVRP